MDLARLIDPGIIITAIAALFAFGWGDGQMKGRGKWLRHLLLVSWAASALARASGADMASTVLVAGVMDLAIVFGALFVFINDPHRHDARAVGGLSLALMPAHWIVSLSGGLTYWPWVLYAVACNAAFVAQCLIVRGWLNGLGRAVARFVDRVGPVSLFRGWGR